MEKNYTLFDVVLYWIASVFVGAFSLFAIHVLPLALAFYMMTSGYGDGFVVIVNLALYVLLALVFGSNTSLKRILNKGKDAYAVYKASKPYRVGDTITLPEFDSASDNIHSTRTPQG